MRIGPHQPLPHGPQSLPGQPYGEWTTLSLASGAPLLQRGERQVPGTGESGGYWTHPKLGKQVLHSVGLDQEQLEESTSPRRQVTERLRDFLLLMKGVTRAFWVRGSSQVWSPARRPEAVLAEPREVKCQLWPPVLRKVIGPGPGHHRLQEVTAAGTGLPPYACSGSPDLPSLLRRLLLS